VERGEYLVAPGKITLAPYPANGEARGFEFDLYAGDLFLIGNSQRLVQLQKIPGSETDVTAKALDPAALKGERGAILGRWTANRPTSRSSWSSGKTASFDSSAAPTTSLRTITVFTRWTWPLAHWFTIPVLLPSKRGDSIFTVIP